MKTIKLECKNKLTTIRMIMINYLFIIVLSLSCTLADAQENHLKWDKPNLKGHWKLIDTKIVDEVPFLNLKAPELDPMIRIHEDSPWDHYSKYDLVFENDSMYKVHYPIQAFESVRFFVDTGYLHLSTKEGFSTYPILLVNDTLLVYRLVKNDKGYFKEAFVRTNFNDSTLHVMKKYGINYLELAGTWTLIREEDYDYGTHYELVFPHKIPDSNKLSRKQMIAALEHPKIYMMTTDGVKRDYSFWYDKSGIHFKPGKWYKGDDHPGIHFYLE